MIKLKVKKQGLNTLVIQLYMMIQSFNMVQALNTGQMVHNTQGSGATGSKMVMVSRQKTTAYLNMKAIGSMVNSMAMEGRYLMMEPYMMAIGLMEVFVVRVSMFGMMGESTWVNGKTIS